MTCSSGDVSLDDGSVFVCYRCKRMQAQSEVAKYSRGKQGQAHI